MLLYFQTIHSYSRQVLYDGCEVGLPFPNGIKPMSIWPNLKPLSWGRICSEMWHDWWSKNNFVLGELSFLDLWIICTVVCSGCTRETAPLHQGDCTSVPLQRTSAPDRVHHFFVAQNNIFIAIYRVFIARFAVFVATFLVQCSWCSGAVRGVQGCNSAVQGCKCHESWGAF